MPMYNDSSIIQSTSGDDPSITCDEKWFYCPICGKKLAKYKPFAVSAAVYIMCKGCKNVVEIKI